MKKLIILILLFVGLVPTLRADVFTDAEVATLQQIIREGYLGAIIAEVRAKGYQKGTPEYEWALERYTAVQGGKMFGAIRSVMSQPPGAFLLFDTQKMISDGGIGAVYSVTEDAGLLKEYIRPLSIDTRNFEFFYSVSIEGKKVPLLCFPDETQLSVYITQLELEKRVIPDSNTVLQEVLDEFFLNKFQRRLEGDVASAAGILNFALGKNVITPKEVARQSLFWSVFESANMRVGEHPRVMMLDASPEFDARALIPGSEEQPINNGQLLIDPAGFGFSPGKSPGTLSVFSLVTNRKSMVGFSAKEEGPWILYGTGG